MAEGTGTRSSLLWEVKRLLDECEELPQILMMENVPQVHGKKNMADFQRWIDYLSGKGYTNVWNDLNAKDYGVPQSRNRAFMFSFLGGHEYQFPDPIELKRCVADLLEDEVDEKYYIGGERTERLLMDLINRNILPEPGGALPVDGTTNNPNSKKCANTIMGKYRGVSIRRNKENVVVVCK